MFRFRPAVVHLVRFVAHPYPHRSTGRVAHRDHAAVRSRVIDILRAFIAAHRERTRIERPRINRQQHHFTLQMLLKIVVCPGFTRIYLGFTYRHYCRLTRIVFDEYSASGGVSKMSPLLIVFTGLMTT